ncbi:HAMP domain-containing protein, partial [Piscinibacter defluvii]|uniref:HAMP domain-containing protein n=1 Tax=Piscinibacter defluvii TaxID=1796922 RepID=UPI000FDEC49F
MKLSTKLLAAPLLTAGVVLGIGQLNTWWTTREALGAQQVVRDGFEQFRTLSTLQQQLGQTHAGVYRSVAIMGSLDDAKVKALRADLARQVAAIKQSIAALDGQAQAGNDFATRADKYLAQADMAIDMSSVDPNTGIAALRSADESYAALGQALASMVAQLDAQSGSATATANASVQRISLLLGLLGLLAAGAAVGLSWLTQRRLVADLNRAVAVTGAVAAGDLRVQVHSDRRDEVGELLRALGAMAGQLGRSLATVADSAGAIRHASAEIASGNQDLSGRTEQA